jgi:hypothetical protein
MYFNANCLSFQEKTPFFFCNKTFTILIHEQSLIWCVPLFLTYFIIKYMFVEVRRLQVIGHGAHDIVKNPKF